MSLPKTLKYFAIQYRSICTTNTLLAGSPVILAHSVRQPRSNNEKMGKPVVILHGMMGSKTNWNSISRMIKDGLNHSRPVINFCLKKN